MLDVCPWNLRKRKPSVARIIPLLGFETPEEQDLMTIDAEGLQQVRVIGLAGVVEAVEGQRRAGKAAAEVDRPQHVPQDESVDVVDPISALEGPGRVDKLRKGIRCE